MAQVNEYDYEEKFVESLKSVKTNSMKQKLVAVKNLVVKRLALEKEFKGLHFKLEAKYEELYRPIYEKRAKILDGTQEVTVDEIKDQLANVTISDANATNSEKGVPGFWLKALKNSAQFGQDINKKDEDVLAFLKDITVEFKENGSFKLNFFFNTNQFFDSSVLTREFVLDAEKLSISKITSTKIEWKNEDLNPTIEKKKKKIKNKKKEVKIVTKVEEVPSFFNFFKDYDVSKINKEKKEEDDEEEEEEDELDIIEEEYDLGLFIKEELIPYAIEYYLGIVKDEGEDGEDFEDFEDEEEEEEEPVPKKGGKKAKF